MEYTIIKTKKQYNEYCERVWELANKKPTEAIEDEMELIELLMDKWEADNFKKRDVNPIELLKNLMQNRSMSQTELAAILGVQKSYVSQILNYRKGLSKDVIRKLAETFKVTQEAFNREYQLISKANIGHVNEKMMNVKKKMKAG